MKSSKLRVIVPLALLLIAGAGFVAGTGTGTLSAIGWQDISILCPLGALGTMLASKTIVPRAIVSLVIAVIAIVLVGRAFCGWVCPVPVWSKLRTLFKKQAPASETALENNPGTTAPLTPEETKVLKAPCNGGCHAERPANSRHLILGGSLLSAAIFGFPMFCLICPIGLSFALVFVLIMLFGGGDVTWSVILIPLVLLAEVVFFRKWCSHLCPLASLMSLIGKMNRTFRPTIDDGKCLETAHGAECGRCAQVCETAIDLRHPENGASLAECTKCRACVDACPGKAISMPLLARTGKKDDMPRAAEDPTRAEE